MGNEQTKKPGDKKEKNVFAQSFAKTFSLTTGKNAQTEKQARGGKPAASTRRGIFKGEKRKGGQKGSSGCDPLPEGAP